MFKIKGFVQDCITQFDMYLSFRASKSLSNFISIGRARHFVVSIRRYTAIAAINDEGII